MDSSWHPYHLQKRCALRPTDQLPRLEFCNWLSQNPNHNVIKVAPKGQLPLDFKFDSRNDIRETVHVWGGMTSDGDIMRVKF